LFFGRQSPLEAFVDEKELAKQLGTYADSITAFAFVQGVAFCVLCAQSVSLACAVKAKWYIAASLMVVATVIYLLLVRRCQDAEDELVGVPGDRGAKIGKVVRMIRAARFLVVLGIGLGETALVLGVRFSKPVFDCAAGCK
jgi:hypothetical protein